MKLKDLYQSTKALKSSSLNDIAKEVESQNYIEQYSIDQQRFFPNVDFSEPKNFAFYGSAEKYYSDAFLRIRTIYPYDGSQAEKIQWTNESTFIDHYIFEQRYPRFNGYVNLGYPTWGTLSGSLIDGYGKSTTDTYIKTFGGPHDSNLKGLPKQFGDANIYDTSKSRESNLKLNLQDGMTIEMWLKKPTFDIAKTKKEVLFDLWNGEASGSAQYGRFRLELTGAAAGSPFIFTALSGTTGVQNRSIGQNLTTASVADWTHVALSLKNSGSALETNLYINGQLNKQEKISSVNLNDVTGSLVSFIGALQTAPSGSPTIQVGAGKFSGSIDELRYWKTERTSKEIGRHYWTQIGGGTNTDEANTNLGVYYKFNEGITTTASIDSVVLDYSGRLSNGAWTGYQSGARTTESAMVLSKAAKSEFKDPVIRSSHPDYISVLSELETSGSYYDTLNNSSIFHTMPGWILEDDDAKDGNLRNLTQIIASYFDNLQLHISEMNHIKDIYSHFQTVSTDINNNTSMTGTIKPLPFADQLLTNAGFVAPELFADSTILEALAQRSEDESYELKLHNVKNQIYQNVYSGLINTMKEKGTNKSFRNILHAFGIDEDVVKINFYGNNVDFEVKDRHSVRSVKEKFVDFNHSDRFAGSIYPIASGSNISYITGSAANFEKFIPITYETQVIFPNKLSPNEAQGFDTPFLKSVIGGIHQATSNTTYTIPGTDNCSIMLYSQRDELESKRAKFHLSSSALGVHLSSSLFEGTYDNSEWLFSFKLTNDKRPNANFVSASSDANYTLHFLGYNTVDSTELNSFNITSSVTAVKAQAFLTNSKRIYAGAKRLNFTGSIVERTDVKIGFVRYWMNELSNDTIKRHSYDSTNYGAESPFRSAYLMETEVNKPKVPEIDTLILNWDFKTLSTTDSNGQITILDASSGSGQARYDADFEAVKRNFNFAQLDFMPASSEKAIDVEYITAARSTYPEILQGDDMIEIRKQDDIKFTKNTLPQEFYIAFEKSMAQTISQEMINFMSSVTDFNNLIGRPVERYRMEYKALSKLRQLFFERVSNEPDLDKYIDYYKWLDDALGEMLVALVPASLKHSDGINNVVENYIFSRDKYTNKFPTIEFKTPEPEGGMNTINRHLYPWKTGHAPIGATPQNKNCYWWLERAERDRPPLSGSASGSNNSRVKVFQARNSVLNRSYTTAQHFAVDVSRHVHSGINYDPSKKRDYVWSATKEVSESPATYGQFGTFPLRYVLANNDMWQSLKDCTDDRPITEKIKISFSAIDGFESFHHFMSGGLPDGVYPGNMIMPFNVVSSSVKGGYSDLVDGIPDASGNVDVVNVHSDTIDETNVIPMQSPFTERWVGGHQHRHAPINRGADTEAKRGEGYKILLKSILGASGSIGYAGADYPYPYANQTSPPFFRFDQAKARYFREERAKRPINTRNIQTSGSQVGNYSKNYQFVHTVGRTQNKTGFRDIASSKNLHNTINSTLPETNLEASLVSRAVGGKGNVASNFNTSSLYLGGIKTTEETSIAGTGRSVIASRFSAPGGFETMSEVFLDMYSKEASAYNALPFRNLQVRGLGSGEDGTIRLIDIHGNRYGLLTHLTRHTAQFGIDSVLGDNNPAFHKTNKNPKWDASESAYDNDNYWIQHQIPQSDYQYRWIKSSHTASLATSSLRGHNLSNFSEPSGTSSTYPYENVGYTVPSQSVLDQRITGATIYGYPSWEQVRNNDTAKNVILKKAYGFNINQRLPIASNVGTFTDSTTTIEESRITANIPNYTDMAFKGESFRFVYPYVNMKYHFDNKQFAEQGVNPNLNESMYENILGYYKAEDATSFSLEKINVRQNLFPDFLKHTKYDSRHRHYFVSKVWADGENALYNTNTGPQSYSGLNEEGRRKTNVTASLFSLDSLNSQIKAQVTAGLLTNIIPSQSVWSMDSRTNFTSSSPSVAASNSAGAAGVLQNQDHHFHNGQSTFETILSGTAATGSFKVMGATRLGTPASGKFTVQGMLPTGIAASGSFEVTGANVQGTKGTGQFTTQPTYSAAVSSSLGFSAVGRTVLATNSSASFEVSGAFHAATSATATFALGQLPVGGNRSHAIFDLAYELSDDGHKLKIGRNSDTDYFEIDLDNSVAGSNTALPLAVDYQKAAPLTGSMIMSGSIVGAHNTQLNEEFVIAAWTKISSGSLEHNNKKYIYYNGTTGGDIATELYFDGGTLAADQRTLVFTKHHEQSSSPGSHTFKWADLGANAAFEPDSWQHLTLVYRMRESSGDQPFVRLYLNSNYVAGVHSFTNKGTSQILNTANEHFIMSHPTDHEWNSGETVSIANMHIMVSGAVEVTDPISDFDARANQIAIEAWQSGKYAPLAHSASVTLARYSFGDDSSDDARVGSNKINDVNSATTNHLDLGQDLSGTAFTDSKFANKKYTGINQHTSWFDAVRTAIRSDNSNSTYFDIDYVAYTQTASIGYNSSWWHPDAEVNAARGFAPADNSFTSQILSSQVINYARFFVVSKAESTLTTYTISPAVDNGSDSGQQASFVLLDSTTTGSVQTNSIVGSIEDTGITIGGTAITINHHNNSQTGNKVNTFLSTYVPCLSGSNGDGEIKNTSYPAASSIHAANDISVSFYAAYNSTAAGTQGIFVLDSSGGNTIYGALAIVMTSTSIVMRAYESSSVVKTFSVTYSSLGVNKEDLNHYVFTFDVSAMTVLVYANNGTSHTPSTSGTATSFSHTYTEIHLANLLAGSIYELTGKMCQLAVWDKVLSQSEISEIYHDGRVKNLNRHTAVANLVHWYKLGQEASWPSVTSDLTSFTTIPDSTPRGLKVDLTVGDGTDFSSENGLPDNTVSDATFRTTLNNSIDANIANFNADNSSGAFTITATSAGAAGNGTAITEDSLIISSVVTPTAGGSDQSGSVNSSQLDIAGINFIADTASRSDSSPNFYIDATSTDTAFWNALSASVKANSIFGTVNISGAGSTRVFSLTSSATGADKNVSMAIEAGTAFGTLVVPAGGTDETGATDDSGHYINFFAISGDNNHSYFIRADKDNTNTGGLAYSASVAGGTGITTIYVDSTRDTNTQYWDSIKAAIASVGSGSGDSPPFSASYTTGGSPTTASFVITNYITGAAGNGGLSGNGGYGGTTFTMHSPDKFSGGSDASGAANGDTVTVGGVTFTLTHGATSSITEVRAAGVSNDVFWASLKSKIDAQTVFVATTGSDNPRTFSIESDVTGSSQNPSISESGTSFAISSAGVAGTNESGAENGDTITIDGSTFAINIGSGLGTGSTADFYASLRTKIIAATAFDTITTTAVGGGFTRFDLTSSVTGTAKNVSFVQNTNGARTTFRNLAGAAGGTSPIGIQDLDYIRFRDETNARDRYFAVDLNGDESNGSPTDYVYIDASSYSGTDSEKSVLFWNDLKTAIIANTSYDTITYTTGSNIATFSITSSVTGTAYNSDILAVYQGANDFAIVSNTAGGTDEKGSAPGNTVTIDGTVFTIVHSGSPSATQINASGVTDTEFFNALSASIKANTSFVPTYTVASNTASFALTSSVTGTAKNTTILESGDSFSTLVGAGGGTNRVTSSVKFKEIIPQPRYNYPHALSSPGSLRSPTAKSNLGLINSTYKLRSNHFNLTRSLGYATDGLYDNTSRWQTPDLSGLKPFDSDYDTWYENIRGHNKHFSLIPEFRISSHVAGIVKLGSSEISYFDKNYWLELTGTSLDSGSTVAKNTINVGGNTFLEDYSLSTNIRNMEGFIEDNAGEATVAKLTLTCDAIMSFLPYEGFYPQSRTVQMCEAFANSYSKHFTAEEADTSDTNLEFPDNNIAAQSRPIFDSIMSPGLLYNTIKSGIAVDYPVLTSKLATASLTDPYGGNNYMVNNEYFDDRLPFETLINPESHLKDKKIVDTNPHISSSFNLKASWNGLGDINYKLMSNNFFAETIEFFLEDGKTSRIISKPDSDPTFGVVIANHAGHLPVYRSIFKVYKSKKAHPWVEFKGTSEVIKVANSNTIDQDKKDKYYNRPPSGTNHFLKEYGGLTGSALEYNIEKVQYPRPQMNPYAEVETITMYSQPNSFGPPCAGGVAVEFTGLDGDTPLTGQHNNTTYMMYDSTNGYNSPFTPPYYDGEAWAIYTFSPEKAGKHTLDEILQNTTVEYLRYELNHESGSYGDRGTSGPQGLSINENAMQIDASFNLFKQVQVLPAKFGNTGNIIELENDPNKIGKAWVIESKFETPILDFSKYLNRAYNAVFESDVSTSDIFTASLHLSGTRTEPNVLGATHSSLAAVHQLSGILNPIGMWHQYGEFPSSDDKGIFMQMVDVPREYTLLGTEMTIANPKYAVVTPDSNDCDGSGLDSTYNREASKKLKPYFKQQEMRRKLVGQDDLSVVGSSIQLINKEDGIIIDTEIKLEDIVSVYGSITNAQSSSGIFNVFTSSVFTKSHLTTHSSFTGSNYQVFINATASSGSYPMESSGSYHGNWATAYYNFDRASTYKPLLIDTKDYLSLSYDYGDFPKGVFEDFLKEFSIGIKYTEQSSDFSDSPDVGCYEVKTGVTKIIPSNIVDMLTKESPSITSLAKIDMSKKERLDLLGVKSDSSGKTQTSYKVLKNPSLTRKFRLIPANPAVKSTPTSAQTSSYSFPEPTFVRASIRYNAGAAVGQTYANKPQMAPQNDKNFTASPSTVRWGKFMHNEGSTALTQSLADLVGFSQEKVKMGVTAKTKMIKEAVVAIPYVANENDQRNFLTLDQFKVNSYLFENNIIATDRNKKTVQSQIKVNTSSSLGASILEQIAKMQNYSLPPHLDFIENDVQPLPMYIFEFEKELQREDLNAIWQGVRTESLKKVEFKQSSISHDINADEMLSGIFDQEGGITSLKDLKWMIFKVKQKANSDYNKKMSDDLNDGRFKFEQQNVDTDISNLNYGYNWPYDFFSMVENVKMSIDVEMLSTSDGDLSQAPMASQHAGYVQEYPQAVMTDELAEPVDGTLAPLTTQTIVKTQDRSVVQARQQTTVTTTTTQSLQSAQTTVVQATPNFGDDY